VLKESISIHIYQTRDIYFHILLNLKQRLAGYMIKKIFVS